MKNKETICAIATPPGAGGIGIVRLSGDNVLGVLSKIWKSTRSVNDFESHKMYLGKIAAPDTNTPIDSALCVLMQAPNSYTGENVVEISCHGGHSVLRSILEACCKSGARLAEPGEFTKRAFLNGRMDLVQAEAVADLIASSSDLAASLALDQLEGRLSKRINEISTRLKDIRVFVEASIDFPEEDIELIEKEEITIRLKDISDDIDSLIKTYSQGRVMKEGVRVVIVGKPNVGKSSLFNLLVGHDRSIVHHTPGTTRDLITETVDISGIAFHLTDAAGLWSADHEVEQMGIEKAHQYIKKADMILWVMDGARNLDESDLRIADNIDAEKTVVCVNKSDLPYVLGLEENNHCLKRFSSEKKIKICAASGVGIEFLKNAMVEKALPFNEMKTHGTEGIVITSSRHKRALEDAREKINDAVKDSREKRSAEFIAHHLLLAHDAIGAITGEVASNVILDEIFSRFCIGK